MAHATQMKRNRTPFDSFSFFRNKRSIYSELYRYAIGIVNILRLLSKSGKAVIGR
jgi:hypothetical protein